MFQRLSFDPDTTRAMGAALADVCRALAADRRDRASRRIARKIVEPRAAARTTARDRVARRSRITASIDAATTDSHDTCVRFRELATRDTRRRDARHGKNVLWLLR
jgi:hypothetical protein